jgi:hypothetical protein
MKGKDEDKLSMYEKTGLFVKDHIVEISTVVKRAVIEKANFEEALNELMYIIANAGGQTTGYTQIKENARFLLERSMLKIMRALKAFAIDENLFDLKAKNDYSRTDVERLRDSDLFTTALRIYGLANDNEAGIANYSITHDNISKLDTYAKSFFEVIQLPKDKIGERSSYNKLIELKMAEIDTILYDKFDNYLSLIEFDNVQLYAQYRSARSIDNSRGTSSSKQYSGTVAAGLTVMVVQQDYDQDRSYTFFNKGNADLQIGLSTDGVSINSSSVTLQPGDEISRDASDLNSEGNYLLVQNMGSIDGKYEIKADK